MKSEFKTKKVQSYAASFHVFWFVKKFINNIREYSTALKFREMNANGFDFINDLSYFFQEEA